MLKEVKETESEAGPKQNGEISQKSYTYIQWRSLRLLTWQETKLCVSLDTSTSQSGSIPEEHLPCNTYIYQVTFNLLQTEEKHKEKQTHSCSCCFFLSVSLSWIVETSQSLFCKDSSFSPSILFLSSSFLQHENRHYITYIYKGYPREATESGNTYAYIKIYLS